MFGYKEGKTEIIDLINAIAFHYFDFSDFGDIDKDKLIKQLCIKILNLEKKIKEIQEE